MNTFKLYEQLKTAFPKEAAEALAHVLSEVTEEIQNTVTKQDFAELKAVVRDLAEAQKRTEERVGSLGVAVEQLAEAQKRTEQRVEELAEAQQRTEERVGSLGVAVEQLAEAQKRTEERVGSLGVAVEQLAEAQKRTEQRVEELAEAQKRTEERVGSLGVAVEQLAEAQKRTEQRVEELAEAQQRTEERVDSLGVAVEQLAEAQKRTEQRVEELAEAQKRTEERVEELAEAQQRTEHQLGKLARTQEQGFRLFGLRLEALFARSGSRAEAAFREGIREIVREAGYTVEAYQGQDPEGYINHDAGRSYELDVLVRNGAVIAVEVKSSAGSADLVRFARAVSLFEQQTGRRVTKKVLIAASIREEAHRRAPQLGVTLGIDPSALDE